MKRIISLLLAGVLALLAVACGGGDVTTSTSDTTTTVTTTRSGGNTLPPPYAGGKGTAEEPYLIESAYQLKQLARTASQDGMEGKYFKLTNDIVLNDTSKENWWLANDVYLWPGLGKTASTSFRGHLDGDGHIIEGVCMKQVNHDFHVANSAFGFISYANGASVKNLGFLHLRLELTNAEDVDSVEGGPQASIGGIIGLGTDGTVVENCAITLDFSAPYGSCGAIMGFGGATGHTIRNCLAVGNMQVAQGVFTSGGAGSCRYEDCVSLLTSNQNTLFAWSAPGSTVYDGIYYWDLGPVTLTNHGGNEIRNCKALSVAQLTGAAAKTNCTALDFENVWQVSEGCFPTLRVFGNAFSISVG